MFQFFSIRIFILRRQVKHAQYHQIMTLIVVLYAHFHASFSIVSLSLSVELATLCLCSIHQSQAFCRAPTLSGNNNKNSGTSYSSFILSLLPLVALWSDILSLWHICIIARMPSFLFLCPLCSIHSTGRNSSTSALQSSYEYVCACASVRVCVLCMLHLNNVVEAAINA